MKPLFYSSLLLGLSVALSVHAQAPGNVPATNDTMPAMPTAATTPPAPTTPPTAAAPAAAPQAETVPAMANAPAMSAKDQATAPPATAATTSAPPAAVAGSIPPPPPGKGQVVFFRSSAFTGMAVWFNVRENGVALGKLSNGAYFVQVVDPGAHTYTAATENKNTLHLEVDTGETYYVRGTVQMGFLVGEANMAPSDQATFEKSLKHMHLAAPPEPTKTDAAPASK